MDARLIRDFDATYARVLAHRKAFKDEPWVPGQASTMKPNPHIKELAGDCTHLRGLAALIGPKDCEEVLAKEWKATEKLNEWLVAEVEEDPVMRGARGSYIENPMADALRAMQAHLRGCVRLLKLADAQVPMEDEELTELLAGE